MKNGESSGSKQESGRKVEGLDGLNWLGDAAANEIERRRVAQRAGLRELVLERHPSARAYIAGGRCARCPAVVELTVYADSIELAVNWHRSAWRGEPWLWLQGQLMLARSYACEARS